MMQSDELLLKEKSKQWWFYKPNDCLYACTLKGCWPGMEDSDFCRGQCCFSATWRVLVQPNFKCPVHVLEQGAYIPSPGSKGWLRGALRLFKTHVGFVCLTFGTGKQNQKKNVMRSITGKFILKERVNQSFSGNIYFSLLMSSGALQVTSKDSCLAFELVNLNKKIPTSGSHIRSLSCYQKSPSVSTLCPYWHQPPLESVTVLQSQHLLREDSKALYLHRI